MIIKNINPIDRKFRKSVEKTVLIRSNTFLDRIKNLETNLNSYVPYNTTPFKSKKEFRKALRALDKWSDAKTVEKECYIRYWYSNQTL